MVARNRPVSIILQAPSRSFIRVHCYAFWLHAAALAEQWKWQGTYVFHL